MDKFVLKSNYKPMGDQPQAIDSLANGVLDGDKEQVLLGVTGSGKTFTLAVEYINGQYYRKGQSSHAYPCT